MSKSTSFAVFALAFVPTGEFFWLGPPSQRLKSPLIDEREILMSSGAKK
jgi:hypothetical protein